MLNYTLQRKHLERQLLGKGIEPDKVDLFSRIDRTLTYRENKRNITKLVGISIDKGISGHLSSFELYEKAREQNDRRKSKNLRQDDRIRAKKTYYPDSISKKEYKAWAKNPNRHDIEGIDTRGNFW